MRHRTIQGEQNRKILQNERELRIKLEIRYHYNIHRLDDVLVVLQNEVSNKKYVTDHEAASCRFSKLFKGLTYERRVSSQDPGIDLNQLLRQVHFDIVIAAFFAAGTNICIEPKEINN